MNGYSVENFSADIEVSDYMARFRDENRFMALCRQCPSFGRSWGCPPFGFDTDAFLMQFRQARIFATKVTPAEKGLPIAMSQDLIREERIRIESQLLEMEARYGGRAFAYIGECLHCPKGQCTRPFGLPCRHPEKVRPSLEAFGFDVALTLSELFGIELLWGKNGQIPDYLVIVSAFFHNTTLD